MPNQDIDDLAAEVRRHIDNRAARFMPAPVLLTVKDRAPRSSLGWILCDFEGRTVRALVPGNWNLEGGVVLFAFPPNQPSEPFIVFGAYDSANGSGSYIPPLVAPTYNTVNTSTGAQTVVQTTDQLVKVSSDDTTASYLNGKLVAGTGLTGTEGSGGGNETFTLATKSKRLNAGTTATGNVGSGEDDLISYTIPAATLATNGDSIRFRRAGTFASSANNKRYKIKYGATTIFDTGTLAITAASDWSAEGEIVRTGATTQKAIVTFRCSDTTVTISTDYTAPGETLSGTVVLKATGEATDNDDIVEQFALVDYIANS